MRPRLAGSEAAQSMMDFLLDAEAMFPPVPLVLRPGMAVVNRAMRLATIATMPRWMRRMAGVRQSRLVDVLIRPVMRTCFAAVHLSRRAELAILHQMSPSTVAVVRPIFLGVAPRHPETLSPDEARARYGYAKPTEAHREWRERQRARVGAGEAPSEAGLVESEAVLGAMA